MKPPKSLPPEWTDKKRYEDGTMMTPEDADSIFEEYSMESKQDYFIRWSKWLYSLKQEWVDEFHRNHPR